MHCGECLDRRRRRRSRRKIRKRRSRRREGEGEKVDLCGKYLEKEKVKKERQEKK